MGVRLAVRLWSKRLDRELAEGVAPEASAAHFGRSRLLLAPGQRRQLARTLRRVVAAASPATPARSGVPVCREQVLDARGRLEALAARLEAPVPLSPRGVASVRVLVTDGAGPLYRRTLDRDLGAELERLDRSLEPVVRLVDRPRPPGPPLPAGGPQTPGAALPTGGSVST